MKIYGKKDIVVYFKKKRNYLNHEIKKRNTLNLKLKEKEQNYMRF